MTDNWVIRESNFQLKLMGKHNGGALQYTIMDYLISRAKEHYTCKRPPGAAGALLYTPEKFIFCGVWPPDRAPTCKEAGCEIEYSALSEGNVIGNPMPRHDKFHPHCVRTIHAEQRAIILAARFGIATEGAVIYSVLKPCYQCSKAIIAAGIRHIYYAGAAYDEPRTQKILDYADVICDKIDIDLEYGQ